LVSQAKPKIEIQDLNYAYGGVSALRDVTLAIPAHAVTVVFGPAGGGKTTLLRLINRLNDLVDGTQMSGRVLLDGQDIYAPGTQVAHLRRRVGMVFALPLPLPGTIRENVLYGPMLAGTRDRTRLDEILMDSLSLAALWDEVKDRLDAPARALSGGQQQRLCIARSLALEPEVLLLSTGKVENTLAELKEHYTIVIVPHSVQQAARVADHAAFFLMGELVEQQPGKAIFAQPQDQRTEDYVTGRFG
jgi:phosphate transport system ATP-binding protein